MTTTTHATRKRLVRAAGLALVLLLAAPVAMAEYDAGLTYFKQGKYVQAAAEFEEVVNNAPEHDYSYFMLGNCYLKLKKYKEAEQQYRKAAELNSGRFEYHMMLAQAQLQLGRYESVVSTLDKAESLIPDAGRKKLFYRTRGLALSRVKDYGRARSDLEKAGPEADYTVAMELGRACFAASDNGCVESALGKALAKKPDDPSALELLTKSQVEAARRSQSKSTKRSLYGKAVSSARKLVATGKNPAEAHELLGAALLGSDDFKGAVTEFRTVLQSQPRNCNAMLNVAQAQSKLGDWSGMLEMSRKAASCDPKSPVAQTQIAFVHNKQKNWAEAEAAAKKALSIRSGYGPALQQIEIAKQGRDAAASHAQAAADEAALAAAQAAAEREEAERQQKIKEYETKTGGGRR